ncbi:MAG: GntR family transcriptional regulator [Bacteroidota bacterium]|jgi:DNA-binding GntR family transcriptional regulator
MSMNRTRDQASFASAAEYAYASLREGIESGEFLPGRRMREVEIAQWLGVSRTPVRQALARLELEGLLVLTPRHGLTVASLDADAIAELYDVRAALEGTAAALAARSAAPGEIAALLAMVEAERKLPAEPRALSRHNLSFHQLIAAAAHNRFLGRSLQSINDALKLLGPTTLTAPGRQAGAVKEHGRIVKAIAARDAAAADAAAREHVLAAYKIRLARLALAKSKGEEPTRDTLQPAPRGAGSQARRSR